MLECANPRYNENGTIDLEFNHPSFGWIPFTASPDDIEEHGVYIFNLAKSGEFGEVALFEDNG